MSHIVILKKRCEFEAVYDQGERVTGHGFAVVRLMTQRPEIRFGLTVTKKLGNAVVRNRLRRRLKAALAILGDGFRPGYDVVLIPRPRVISLTWRELLAGLTNILTRAGVLNAGQVRG